MYRHLTGQAQEKETNHSPSKDENLPQIFYCNASLSECSLCIKDGPTFYMKQIAGMPKLIFLRVLKRVVLPNVAT